MEEYNKTIHDEMMINKIEAQNAGVEEYEDLMKQILNKNLTLTDEEYQKEMQTLIDLDDTHKWVFNNTMPTIEEWKERRKHYAESDHHDDFDQDKKTWWNTLDIRVYVRDPKKYVDKEAVKIFTDFVKAKVPGTDFQHGS